MNQKCVFGHQLHFLCVRMRKGGNGKFIHTPGFGHPQEVLMWDGLYSLSCCQLHPKDNFKTQKQDYKSENKRRIRWKIFTGQTWWVLCVCESPPPLIQITVISFIYDKMIYAQLVYFEKQLAL